MFSSIAMLYAPGQSGPGSDGKEELLYIPSNSSVIEASASDCLASYLGHSSYPSAEIQSVYFSDPSPVDWARLLSGLII